MSKVWAQWINFRLMVTNCSGEKPFSRLKRIENELMGHNMLGWIGCPHWAFSVLKVATLANKFLMNSSIIFLWRKSGQSLYNCLQCYVKSCKFDHCSFLLFKSWAKVAAACVKRTQMVAKARFKIRVFVTSLFHTAKNRTQWTRRAKWYESGPEKLRQKQRCYIRSFAIKLQECWVLQLAFAYV